MRINRLLITILAIVITNYSWGQFYQGIREVDPYLSKLSKVDIYLQTSPDNLNELYEELYSLAYKKKNKTLETVLHIYKGTGYYYTGQSDSAIVYFEKAIDLSGKIKNNTLLSTARIRKIFVIGESADSKVAHQLMKDEYDFAISNRDTLNMIYALNGMSLFGKESEKDAGSDANMKAMQLAIESGNEYEYGFLLNNIGVTKLDLGDQEGALKDFQKGLEIARKAENVRLELTVLMNMGYYFMEVDSIDLAEEKFNDVYNQATNLRHYQLAVTSMINLGGLYRQQEDYIKSDSLIKSSLNMAKNNDMYYLVSLIYLNRAQLNLVADNYKGVERCLDSANAYQKFTPNNDVQMGIFQINYLMHKNKGDFKTALTYYQRLKGFQDSINDNGRLQVISALRLKYDVEKKEKERVQQANEYENKLTEQELNQAKLERGIAIGSTIVVLLIAFLIIYYFRSKHKRESEFSAAMVNKMEEERGRIARDLHDGLGQSLIVLKNKFNKIESGAVGLSEELNENFSDTIEEVRNISRSLIPPELRRLGLRKSLNKMLKDVEFSAGIVVSIEIDDLDIIELDQPSEIRIYRIIQELTNNTIKHSEATSLKLEVIKNDNSFTIVYQDNGKGVNVDKLDASSNSVGLRSIRQRMNFLNGTVRFEKPGKGFKAIIKIKIKK